MCFYNSDFQKPETHLVELSQAWDHIQGAADALSLEQSPDTNYI